MEVYYCKTKLLGGSMLILILLNASCCGGGTVGILVKSNATNFQCDGRLEECLIMEDDLEMELLMNPYISRMLAETTNIGTKDSKDPNKAVTCGQENDVPPQNSKCIGQPSGKRNKNNPCPPLTTFARYKCP